MRWLCEPVSNKTTEELIRHATAPRLHASAITWFFDNEEMGIILEDDCLPSQSFFWFCEELLLRYKDDSRVWHIDGTNFQENRFDYGYDFSKYALIWGWASWRRAWRNYDIQISGLPEFIKSKTIESVWDDKLAQKYWIDCFNRVHTGGLDAWDYQWFFCIWSNSGLTIRPRINMIKNIGFSGDATHTIKSSSLFDSMEALEFTDVLTHPSFVVANKSHDANCSKVRFGIKGVFPRALRKIKTITTRLLSN